MSKSAGTNDKPRGKPLVEVLAPKLGNPWSESNLIKATAMQAVTFFDTLQKRQVIVLYSLGADGIIREYNNNKWNPYPILS